MSRSTIFISIFSFSILFLGACSGGAEAPVTDEGSETSEFVSETETEEDETPETTQNEMEGKIVLKVGEHEWIGSSFLLDPSTPRAEWQTNKMEGMENETPIVGMTMISQKPNDFSVALGYSGDDVNSLDMKGTYSLNAQSATPFTISLNLDGQTKNFTFDKGEVNVVKMDKEGVKLTATGSGLFADLGAGKVEMDQPATFEVEIEFPNVLVDGAHVKQVE